LSGEIAEDYECMGGVCPVSHCRIGNLLQLKLRFNGGELYWGGLMQLFQRPLQKAGFEKIGEKQRKDFVEK
jgi:hypothetical protein